MDGSSLGCSPFVPTGRSGGSLTSSGHTGQTGRAGHGRSGSGTPPVARIFGVKADVAAPKEGANGDANGRRIDNGKASPRTTPGTTGSFGSGGSGGSGSSTPKVGFLPPPSGEERRGEKRRCFLCRPKRDWWARSAPSRRWLWRWRALGFCDKRPDKAPGMACVCRVCHVSVLCVLCVVCVGCVLFFIKT